MESKEREANWYDDAYSAHLKKSGEYSKSPEKSVYFPLWEKVIEWIPDKQRIIDYGCGVGQFAELCKRAGKWYVYGCDFSEVAIQAAKKRNPSIEQLFRVKDLRNEDSFNFAYYDVAVFLEVLEHIEFDRELLGRIWKDKRIIMSLPNYMCSSHVRCFKDGQEIAERYGDILFINNIAKIKMSSSGKCIWLLDCKRR